MNFLLIRMMSDMQWALNLCANQIIIMSYLNETKKDEWWTCVDRKCYCGINSAQILMNFYMYKNGEKCFSETTKPEIYFTNNSSRNWTISVSLSNFFISHIHILMQTETRNNKAIVNQYWFKSLNHSKCHDFNLLNLRFQNYPSGCVGFFNFSLRKMCYKLQTIAKFIKIRTKNMIQLEKVINSIEVLKIEQC